MNTIHPTAVVDPKAELQGVTVGPYAVIDKNVRILDGTVIESHAVIRPYTQIGTENHVGHHVVIGADPQDFSFDQNLKTGTEIGNRNTFREGVTIHRASKEGNTLIGNNCYLMANAHVAHDCKIHDAVTIVNGSLMAGHVEVFNNAFISAFVGIHQFGRIGQYAMIAGMTRLSQDAPPFALTEGYPGRYNGLNVVGLRRANISPAARKKIKACYKIIYGSGLTIKKALAKAAELDQDENTKLILDFFLSSQRGVVKASSA